MAYLAKMTGQNRFKIYLHAEVLAILRAGDRPIHTITIERYHKNGSPALAKPCKMCQLFIEMNGIKKVIHT
jgi:tRNA(Arg) A34 adenosine deaminase TadA